MPTINNTLHTITSGVTTGVLSQENQVFYDKLLLKRLVGNLVYAKYGQKKAIPKNSGDTINFRRFNTLTPPASALTEGVTPTGNNATITVITATVQQYGDYMVVTDQLDLMSIDAVITEFTEMLGEQAGTVIDNVVRDVIYSGTSVRYAGSRASRATLTSADTITGDDIRLAVKDLRNNKVKPFEDGYYIMFVDADVAYDLAQDTLWQDVSKYNGGKNIKEGEIGKIHGAKAVNVSNPKTFAGTSSLEVHGTLIFGKDAYAVVDIEGSKKPEIIVKPFGYGDDPLNQRASIGWKALFTAVRLQELAMIRIESAVS